MKKTYVVIGIALAIALLGCKTMYERQNERIRRCKSNVMLDHFDRMIELKESQDANELSYKNALKNLRDDDIFKEIYRSSFEKVQEEEEKRMYLRLIECQSIW